MGGVPTGLYEVKYISRSYKQGCHRNKLRDVAIKKHQIASLTLP